MTENDGNISKKWGYAYSAASVIIFLPALLILMFGAIFVYDNPRGAQIYTAHMIFFPVMASPLVLAAANVMSWRALKRQDGGKAALWMLSPALYLALVFITAPLAGQAAKTFGWDKKVSFKEALYRKDAATAKAMLTQGLKLDKKEATALLFDAAFMPDRELAEMAIQRGADVNARHSSVDWTPLLAAAQKGDAGLVKLLLEKGADPDAACPYDANPFMKAASGGDLEVMRTLLNYASYLNRRDVNGETALMYAINSVRDQDKDDEEDDIAERAEEEAKCLKTAAFLLDRKADTTIRSKSGLTALALAKKKKLHKIESLLKSRGVKE